LALAKHLAFSCIDDKKRVGLDLHAHPSFLRCSGRGSAGVRARSDQEFWCARPCLGAGCWRYTRWFNLRSLATLSSQHATLLDRTLDRGGRPFSKRSDSSRLVERSICSKPGSVACCHSLGGTPSPRF